MPHAVHVMMDPLPLLILGVSGLIGLRLAGALLLLIAGLSLARKLEVLCQERYRRSLAYQSAWVLGRPRFEDNRSGRLKSAVLTALVFWMVIAITFAATTELLGFSLVRVIGRMLM